MGTIWSSSPCARKIGTSRAFRSSVKSVSENALTQSYAAARFTSIPWRQKSSRAPCETFEPSRFAPKNGTRQVLVELRAILEHALTDAVERLDRRPLGVRLGLHHDRRHRAGGDDLGDAADAVLRRVPDDLAAAGGVPDHHEVVQVQRVDELGEVAGVGVHVVARVRLRRAAVAAAVVGDGPVAGVRQQLELDLPCVGATAASRGSGGRAARCPARCSRSRFRLRW